MRTTQFPPSVSRGHHRGPAPRSSRRASAIAFAASAGLVIAYALPGGAYDIVVRQAYGIVVWWVLGTGFALGLLPRARPGRSTLVMIGALAAYAAWTAISLGWTESAERTTAELARVLDYLGLVALVACTADRDTWRAAAAGLGCGAMLVCVLALGSRVAPSLFPAASLAHQTAGERLSYPFGYWNAVGAWGAMSAMLGLAWSVHARARVQRAAALGLVPVAVLVTYLSYSRAAVAGMAVGLLVVLAFSHRRGVAVAHAAAAAGGGAIAILAVRGAPAIAQGTGTTGAGSVVGATVLAVAVCAGLATLTSLPALARVRMPEKPARALALGGAVLAAFLLAAVGPRLAQRGWQEFKQPVVVQSADPATRLTAFSGTRYELWRSAIDAYSTRPITGTGGGTFEFWWDRQARSPEFVRNAHSLELENMAELGMPGLLLILAVMAAGLAVLAMVRRRCRRSGSVGAGLALLAAFAVYLWQASIDWMWQSTAVTVLALAGVAVAGGRLAAPRPGIRWYSRTAVCVAAVAAAVIQLPGLVSTMAVRRSQAAERAGNGALALSWANAAVNAEPWGASPYEQRGLVLEAARRLAPAAADLRRAASREPTNFRHWLLLARVHTERDELAAALSDYERARALRPDALVFASGHG